MAKHKKKKQRQETEGGKNPQKEKQQMAGKADKGKQREAPEMRNDKRRLGDSERNGALEKTKEKRNPGKMMKRASTDNVNKKRKRSEENSTHKPEPAALNPNDKDSSEKWSKSKKKRMRKLKAKQSETTHSTTATSKISVETNVVAAAADPSPQTKGTKSKLLDAFKARLTGSRFRILNEELYTKPSESSFQRFTKEPELYEQYHEGFRKQVEQWPVNPVDRMIASIKSNSDFTQTTVVADFGCGDAEIARQLLKIKVKDRCPFVVHSFDLVAGNELVTACDMAHTPLSKGSVDIAVFCLALMGTNLADFIREAYRVLKPMGRLKIAEVRSRFESKAGKDEIGDFVQVLDKLGFECMSTDMSNKMFVVLELRKNGKQPNRKLVYTAKPCIYKRR